MWMRMTQNKAASDDGINLLDFVRGEAYDLSPKLHAMFKRERWATECAAPRPKKARKKAPENKADETPEDK